MIKSVQELKVGDTLTNTNHNFDIEIREIGKKNVRYVNLETPGEKVFWLYRQVQFYVGAPVCLLRRNSSAN